MNQANTQLPPKLTAHLKSWYHNRRVLVTGGAGFIGSLLVKALLDMGASVTVLDTLSRGTPAHFTATKLIKGSITDKDKCLEATQGIDIVFHTAAVISVSASMGSPLTCHDVNVTGVANLLDSCRINKVERFVFSSSSAVYGMTNTLCSEQTPCAPTSPYGYSKLIGELYCQQYAQLFGVKTVCLRYFNVYSPAQPAARDAAAVMPRLRYQLQNSLPLTIFGDGTQTRDFVTVSNVVNANLILGTLPAEHMNGQAFNIASGTSISLHDLIARLREDYPESTSPIIYEPSRPGDIQHSAADISKYRRILEPWVS